ncbi:hypothetical protein KDA_67310 [Dictyobacter alpinus]|uniref:Uncharacterized protein n=1 Tax=Dictyobacter alpinus TaxID=2014873 RepID=A0A402BIZ6_9CHLR|nr:hypothetical protein [Dictyobacter alpinus]GCE31247.1 hypothetical protein KDA_67310 [Dictyobacter alpinus]
MQLRSIYTFPFTFPRFPRGGLLLSKFQQGLDGLFGVAIEHEWKGECDAALCSFFVIDMNKVEVMQYPMKLPYHGLLSQLHISYDQPGNAWYIAVDALVYGRPVDIYMIPKIPHTPWLKVFTTKNPGEKLLIERSLVGFWQCGDYSPLVMCTLNQTLMYDLDTYWTQWMTSSIEQPSVQYMNTNYQRALYVGYDGCLLFTLQCIYNSLTSDAIYRKMGPGQWCFHIAAYEPTGTLIHQEIIPSIEMPVRDIRNASNDLSTWLTYSMVIGDGPIQILDGVKTCVAALVMQDNPDAKRGPDDPLFHLSNNQQAAQGGLYCVDMQGHILFHDPTCVGLRTSFFAWNEQVIGITMQDGQWQFWNWSPFQGTEHVIHQSFSSTMRRATMIARECKAGEALSWFWCIEEYETGTSVTQRFCDTFQEKQSLWLEGFFLPDWWMRSGTVDTQPQGIVVYQDSLLLLGVDLKKQLVLYQVQ